jgi:hypothetical protein
MAEPTPHDTCKAEKTCAEQHDGPWLRHLCGEFGYDDLAVAGLETSDQDLVSADIK